MSLLACLLALVVLVIHNEAIVVVLLLVLLALALVTLVAVAVIVVSVLLGAPAREFQQLLHLSVGTKDRICLFARLSYLSAHAGVSGTPQGTLTLGVPARMHAREIMSET